MSSPQNLCRIHLDPGPPVHILSLQTHFFYEGIATINIRISIMCACALSVAGCVEVQRHLPVVAGVSLPAATRKSYASAHHTGREKETFARTSGRTPGKTRTRHKFCGELTHAVSLIGHHASRLSGRAWKRTLERLATLGADNKDQVCQLRMQVSIF